MTRWQVMSWDRELGIRTREGSPYRWRWLARHQALMFRRFYPGPVDVWIERAA